MDPAFAERNVNEGFSGGEKKRHEILQLELLKPKIAILDETDSGLDVDALRVVSEGVNRVRETGEIGMLLITHYTRILRYIKPDFVHVFVGGRIVEEGGPELADKLEAEGYEATCGRRRASLAMRVTSSRRASSTSSAIRKDFPILDRAGPRRQAAGLPRQRGDLAEAAPGARRRCASTTSSTTPTCTAASTRSPRRPPALYEGARDKVAAFIDAPSRDEVVFTKNSTEALNLVANVLGWADEPLPASAPATRSSSPRWSTTPTSCRGSCSRSAPARR